MLIVERDFSVARSVSICTLMHIEYQQEIQCWDWIPAWSNTIIRPVRLDLQDACVTESAGFFVYLFGSQPQNLMKYCRGDL